MCDPPPTIKSTCFCGIKGFLVLNKGDIQKQKIDENRAVHRSLNELRNNIEEIKISIKDISDSDTELSKIIIKEIEKLTETVNNLKK